LSASQSTLSSLQLSHASISDTALVTLLDHFPNLREPHLNKPTVEVERWAIRPSLHRSPRGKLCFFTLSTETDAQTKGILSGCLSSLELGYDEIEIVDMDERSHSTLDPIIFAYRKALTRLKFDGFNCKHSPARLVPIS
jgi:hypothetical protein